MTPAEARLLRLEQDNAHLRAQLADAQSLVRQLLFVIRLGRFSSRVRYLPDPEREVVVPAQRRPIDSLIRRSHP